MCKQPPPLDLTPPPVSAALWPALTPSQQQHLARLLAALLLQYRQGQQQNARPTTTQETNHERPTTYP
jgi:hypothetical protein